MESGVISALHLKKRNIMSKTETKKPNPTQQINPKKISKEEFERYVRNLKDYDSEKVTGVFQNLECRASAGGKGCVSFSYKIYPGEDMQFYELCDGERYTIPRGVARHLNNNCYYKEYQHMRGEFGEQGMRMGAADPRLASKDGKLRHYNMQAARKIHRYAFHSLDFMDDEGDMRPADIVEVTMTP
jgi:hypothetical protein